MAICYQIYVKKKQYSGHLVSTADIVSRMLYWHDNVYCCIYFFGFEKVFLHDCGDFPAFGKLIQSSLPANGTRPHKTILIIKKVYLFRILVSFFLCISFCHWPGYWCWAWTSTPCAISMKIISRRTRESVMGARTKWKEPFIAVNHDDAIYDRNTPTWPKVFISDDLTKARPKLAYHARIMKGNKAILDTWNTNCKIMVKNNHRHISRVKLLQTWQNYNNNRMSHQYSALHLS